MFLLIINFTTKFASITPSKQLNNRTLLELKKKSFCKFFLEIILEKRDFGGILILC